MPGTLRSHTSCVASGVTSRNESPVPPHVKTISAPTPSAASTIPAAIASRSSLTTTCEPTVHPSARINSSKANPAESSSKVRVSEQVTMANVISTTKSFQPSNRRPGFRLGFCGALRTFSAFPEEKRNLTKRAAREAPELFEGGERSEAAAQTRGSGPYLQNPSRKPGRCIRYALTSRSQVPDFPPAFRSNRMGPISMPRSTALHIS